MAQTHEEKLLQELQSLAEEMSENSKIVEIQNKAEICRKLLIRPQHFNGYLDRLIAKRKIRLVYEIIDNKTAKNMASKQKATEEKIASLEQELENMKKRLTALEEKNKAPTKTEKPKQRKLID